MVYREDGKYGKGLHAISADELLYDANAIVKGVIRTFTSPEYRPPTLPSVAIDLLELSKRKDVKLEEVIALMEEDAFITAKFLKVAQAPVYSRSNPVRSLKEALVRLGMSTVRDIVWETAANARLFRAERYTKTMNNIRKHCLATAYISRLICRYTSVGMEYAFLCGLLHDIGVTAMVIVLAERDVPNQPTLSQLSQSIAKHDEEAAAIIAKLWQLPDELQMVIGNHHHFVVDKMPHPLAATVFLASHLSERHNYGLYIADADADADGSLDSLDAPDLDRVEEAKQVLNITDEMYTDLLGQIPDTLLLIS